MALLVAFGMAGNVVAQSSPNAALGKPSAVDQVIDAVRGEPILIQLTTEAKSDNAKVEFVVRDVPLYGELDGLPRIDPRRPTVAVLTYRSDPDSTSNADTFTWYARYSPNGHYSAPGRVSIRLRDPAPVVEVSPQVYFGRTAIGDESVKEVRIANVGNAVYQETLTLSPPWRVVEPEDGVVRLPPGGAQLLKIGYAPTASESTTFHWKLMDSENGSAVLSGEGFRPFKIDPARALLEVDEATGGRRVELSIYAQAPEPTLVTIHTDGRLNASAGDRLMLEPGRKHPLTLSLPPSDPRAYEGFVAFSTEGYSSEVKVVAPATPPRLELEIPDGKSTLSFGQMVPGMTLSRAFRVVNRGGTDAIVTLELPHPFELLSDNPSNVIGAQSGRDYTVVFRSGATSESVLHRESLVIRAGEQTLDCDVSAMVRVDPPPASDRPPRVRPEMVVGPEPELHNPYGSLATLPLPSEVPDVDEDDDRRTPLGFITNDLESRQYSNRVQPVPMFELVEHYRNSLVLGWELPAASQRTFVVDMRQTRYNAETFAIDSVWAPWPDTQFEVTPENKVRATVRGLEPNTIYEMRVLSVTDDGRYAPPSEPLGVLTAPPIDWTWFKRIAVLSVVVVLAWLGRRLYVINRY